jgi:hypothetical protein
MQNHDQGTVFGPGPAEVDEIAVVEFESFAA